MEAVPKIISQEKIKKIIWLVRLNSITSDPNGTVLQKFMIIKYIYSVCICELAHDRDVSQSEHMTVSVCL